MEYGFLSRAGKFLQEQRKHRRWMMMFLCLAGGVTLGTLAFLKLYGQAMTHQVKVLDCQYEVHVHTEDCYEENEDGDKVLVCEYADYAEYVIHVHNDDCYDQKGNLVCPLEEHELHEHDDDCWEEVDVLICGEEESKGSAEDSENKAEAAVVEEIAETAEESQDEKEESGSDAEIVRELDCDKEEHEHDDSCYESGEGCDLKEHTHDDSCYDTTETLVCEESEHTHDDSCYDTVEEMTCDTKEHEHDEDCYDEDGELVCDKEEHEHDDNCYEVTEEMTCDQKEHEHDDSCYEVTKELTCDQEEHEHDDSCEAKSELICDKEEHEHDDSCYIETKAETEKKEVSKPAKKEVKEEVKVKEEETDNSGKAEEGHKHTDACYETEKVLTCGELELHIHDDSCYDEDCFDEDGNLIEGSRVSCGLLQLEEHVHTEECFKTVELTPEEIAALNGGATLHVHTDECYDEEGNLICGHEVTHLHQPECYDEDGNLICGFGVEEKEHEHDANCYDEEGNLTCGHEDAKDHQHSKACYDEEGNLICGYEGVKDHEHDANCYDEEGNLVCGYETDKVHEHDASCYDEEGNLICGYEGSKDHEHDANCYDMYGNLICGYEGAQDHVHTEACYDEEGNLICGYVLREEYANSRTFEGANYVVIVKYDDDANIPEDAELLVEEITPDSDKEHYERRETEYRELLEDEMASMRALLKIGFYVETEDGKAEIEPEAPVMVSVQFLDEDGLPEGRPVTVIHFAEEGTEMLDGGSAVDNSTTFTMKSFSEIAIGYVPEEEQRELTEGVDGTMRLHLSDTFEYEDDAFQITFHVEGEAILPEDTAYRPAAAVKEDAEQKDEDKDTESEAVSEDASEEDTAAETEDAEEADSSEAAQDTEEADTAEDAEAEEDSADAEEQEAADDAASTDTEDETEAPAEAADEADVDAPDAKQAQSDGNAAAETVVKAGKMENPKLRLKVEQLGKGTAEYKAFQELAEKTDGAEELYRLQVMTYSLTYGGEELDLSRCKVTAEIRPTKKLEEKVQESIEDAAAFLIDGDGNAVQSEVEAATEATPYLVEEETAEGTEGADNDAEIGLNDNDAEDKTADGSEVDANTEDDADAEDASDLERVVDAEADEASEPEIYTSEFADTEVRDGEGIEYIEDLEAYFGDPSQYVATDLIISASLMSANNEAVDRASVEYDGSADTFFTMNVPTEAEGRFFGIRASGQPNPKFTVQFYANLDVLATEGANALTMIDTSGKKLPVNKGNTTTSPTGKLKYMYVDGTGKVQTVNKLTEVYSSRNFEYHKAPTINYMNALVENTNYELDEVWVLKEGGDATSTETNDWDIYKYNENPHFTNRKVSADGKTYIYIKDGATIRFVYNTTDKEKDFSAAFYDYDISNGWIYRARPPVNQGPSYYVHKTAGETFSGDSLTSSILTWAGGLSNWDKHLYTYTQEQGINSSGNYSGSGTKLAFGNVNTGTNLGKLTWSKDKVSNELNKYNNNGYEGCTFGLVTGMSDGKIQYASGIQAPKLFNEGDATGKSTYSNYSLQFNRVGDTYTLSAVNGTGATGLGNFSNPTNSTGTHTSIWTNNFWPMDSAPSFGTGTHDVKFGGTATFKGGTHEMRFGPITQRGTDYTFPESDDGKYHNSYFGMHYEVEFDLTKDYVGPLEYYFFGDDDMWVFLDNELVCDIGGVHSSVGEYVNLWDYLHKHEAKCYNEKGELICEEGITHEHNDECYEGSDKEKVLICKQNTKKLSFFYTERGASGSTCWMQFTLPSVSSLTPETTDKDYGELKIEKTVTQISDNGETVADNGDKFKFTINFQDKDGNNLSDDYSYVKYDKNGNEIGHDLIIWDGGEFELKNGEYIIVKYLPQGTRYVITESDQAITVTDNISGDSEIKYFTDITVNDNPVGGENNPDDVKTAEGEIPEGGTENVKYNNKFYVYGLPKTGGPGTNLYTIAGALIILLGAGLLYRKKFSERRV